MKRSIPLKILYAVFMALVVLSFLFVILGIGRRDVDYSFEDNTIDNFGRGWLVVEGDADGEIMDLPVNLGSEYGATITITKRLPSNLGDYNSLLIESRRQSVFAYVDGELRKSYTDEGQKLSNSLPYAYMLVPIHDADAGKEIKFVISTDTYYSGNISAIYIGNEMSIMLKLFKANILWLSLVIITVIVGLICLIGYLVYRKTMGISIHFLYLFWFSVFSAIWCFTQLKIKQVFISDTPLIESGGHCCFLLIPITIALIANAATMFEYKKIYHCILIAMMVNFLTQNILHTALEIDYFVMQNVTQLLIFAILIISIVLCSMFLKKHSLNGLADACIIGLTGYMLGVLSEAVAIGLNKDYIIGSYFIIGTYFFLTANLFGGFIYNNNEQRKKQNAESANKAKSMFLATMSHEIRTPINSVLGMNEMIIRDTKDPVIMEYAQNINSAGNVLLGLINDILDFSKIEFGKLELVITHYETKTLFTDLYNLIEERARKKGLNLEVKMDPQMPTVLEGDMGRIRQIITNFLTNAVKYTETGSVVLSAVMKDPDTNPTLHVDIIDSGQGIRDEDKDRLFSSFTRLNEEKNQSIEGTGLGLAITKQLVAMMNGSISVESTFGVGSTFSVDIPQVVVDNTQVGDFNPARGNRGKSGNRFKITFQYPEGKVLIVDDNKTNLIVATGLLKPTKMKVTTAASGDEAIALVKENEYDLIFMDHMMPVKDGIETLHEMQSIFGSDFKTPVIVLTANAISGMRDMYIKEGFNDYLTKPISTKQLEEMLVSFIGDYRQ